MLISLFLLTFILNFINSSGFGFFLNECPIGWRVLNSEKKFLLLDLDDISKLTKDRKLKDKHTNETISNTLLIFDEKSKNNKLKNENIFDILENIAEKTVNNGRATNLVITKEKIDQIENPEKNLFYNNIVIQCERFESETNVSASRVENLKKEIDSKNKKIEELNTSHKFYKFILALFTIASILIAYSFFRRKYKLESNMVSNDHEMGSRQLNNFNL